MQTFIDNYIWKIKREREREREVILQGLHIKLKKWNNLLFSSPLPFISFFPSANPNFPLLCFLFFLRNFKALIIHLGTKTQRQKNLIACSSDTLFSLYYISFVWVMILVVSMLRNFNSINHLYDRVSQLSISNVIAYYVLLIMRIREI